MKNKREIFEKVINNRKNQKRTPISFENFLDLLSGNNPGQVFKDIFVLTSEMIEYYVGHGIDEYPDDPESINYVNYDTSKLLEDNKTNPFFADRLFANRFVNVFKSMKENSKQNNIFLFRGPHGSGKSTFLNNLIDKFEEYTLQEGNYLFETVWFLDLDKLGISNERKNNAKDLFIDEQTKYVEVPCPCHDNPILFIPKEQRPEIFDRLIDDEQFKHKLFNNKEYEWVFEKEPCTICLSLLYNILDNTNNMNDIYNMIFARRYRFSRKLGEGVSIFNPSDELPSTKTISNDTIQRQLDFIFKDSNKVQYNYSTFAKTNNGIYSLMDTKKNNRDRFNYLHGLISEGTHKVNNELEEDIHSIYLAIVNPEDEKNGNGNLIYDKAFQDRIHEIKVNYVLEPSTEVRIFKKTFGDYIESYFLPGILECLAKIIISSRLRSKSITIDKWIENKNKYCKFSDENLLLLKMDIYQGYIPEWLSEQDKQNFNFETRRKVISEALDEGEFGFSGRESIKIFYDFFSKYANTDRLINMTMLKNYCERINEEITKKIPIGFLDAVERSYDYNVLQQVKECIFVYNFDQIDIDIKNYLFALNYDPGITDTNYFTGKDITITDKDIFKPFEERIFYKDVPLNERNEFRKSEASKYTSQTLQEMRLYNRDITETEQYQDLFKKYTNRLKEESLDPFINNETFRMAIHDYNTSSFDGYENKIKKNVKLLINNLKKKYGYSEKGAIEVSLYVIDRNLPEKFNFESDSYNDFEALFFK